MNITLVYVLPETRKTLNTNSALILAEIFLFFYPAQISCEFCFTDTSKKRKYRRAFVSINTDYRTKWI